MAHDITRFSLSAPPPFDVRAADVIRSLLDTMPTELRCRALKYEDDCMTKDAVLMATHTFWYTFVALLLKRHEPQRDQLLQLMALQYARLTLNVASSRDAFFEHFPMLVAHVVISVMRKHEALGSNPQQQGPAAAGIFRHIVGLMGGCMPSPDRLRMHMRFAERGREDSQSAASRRANLYHVPWGYEPTPGPPQPALGPAVILPLPEASFKSASAWAPVKNLLRAQKSIETGGETMKKSASTSELLARGATKYRPPKVAVDLRRQTPLVQIYKGAKPADVLEKCGLPPLEPPSRSGFQPPPPPEVRKGPTVRQSVPGYGGKTRLGGAASYKAMHMPAMLREGQRRVQEFEEDGRALEMNMRIFEAAIDSKCDDIGRQAEAKCRMDPPLLADYALELTNQILHPDVLAAARP